MNELKILKGRKIGILGLAFKPFTDDLRDAPAYDLAQRLIERGATVVGFDPVSMERAKKEWSGLELQFAKNANEVFEESDAVLLVTEWPEFHELQLEECASRMKHKLILDGRNFMDQERVAKAGIKLITLGRSST